VETSESKASDKARRHSTLMRLYDRFEQLVALVLSAVIAVIILVALVELVRDVLAMLTREAANLLQDDSFQLVFGMIMTLLIALEFKHSIVKVIAHEESLIQVRTVILIALIALARKFVILDAGTGPAKIAALAGAMLALGIVHRLVREHGEHGGRREDG